MRNLKVESFIGQYMSPRRRVDVEFGVDTDELWACGERRVASASSTLRAINVVNYVNEDYRDRSVGNVTP
jgi:hypothetical protein